jgi:hypothetical protein
MRERDQGREGGAWGRGRGARGARARAGPGWAAPWVKIPWHAQPQIEIQFAKQNTKRD